MEKAEAAVEAAEARHREALDALQVEEQAIEQRRRALEQKWRNEHARLEQALEQARQRYRAALEDWAG